MGNFRRIYPTNATDKYDKFFHSCGTLFQETAAFKARSELARWVWADSGVGNWSCL
jgi:tubulin polyglutamylase TTLL6/13